MNLENPTSLKENIIFHGKISMLLWIGTVLFLFSSYYVSDENSIETLELSASSNMSNYEFSMIILASFVLLALMSGSTLLSSLFMTMTYRYYRRIYDFLEIHIGKISFTRDSELLSASFNSELVRKTKDISSVENDLRESSKTESEYLRDQLDVTNAKLTNMENIFHDVMSYMIKSENFHEYKKALKKSSKVNSFLKDSKSIRDSEKFVPKD